MNLPTLKIKKKKKPNNHPFGSSMTTHKQQLQLNELQDNPIKPLK